jgi:hypothetical protein
VRGEILALPRRSEWTQVELQSTPHLNHSVLREETVVVSFQLPGLRPATESENSHPISNDDLDWRTCNTTEKSFGIPGRFIEMMNPEIVTPGPAFIVLLVQESDLKRLPKMAPTYEYPYRTSGECYFNSFVPLTLFLLPRSLFQKNAASSVRIIVIFQDSLMQTRLSARFATLLSPSISLKGTFYFTMSALILCLILRSIGPINPAAYASVLGRNANSTSRKAGGRRGHSGWTEIDLLVVQLR